MATNMAPHNLGECCDAICAYIDNPDIDTDGLMKYIKGPDFPTGGTIMGVKGIKDAYETGRGRVIVRAKTEIEIDDKGRETIVVTEIPYMVNKREMIEKIAQLVEDKKIEGITYVNDESSREGVRAIIRVKQGYNSNVILNTLYKLTPLQSSFSINNVALVHGRPETMNLKSIISNFVDFRHEVVRRRTQFELNKAKKRANILEGLLKAIDIIDEVIATIRASKSTEDAQANLVSKVGFNEEQAKAIVEMRLRQLTGLEREKLQSEYDELVKFIAHCEEVLASDALQLEIVKQETMDVKQKYGDARRTEIVPDEGEFNPEDFYANDDEVITISHQGYIKRTPLTEYRTQNRGGKGMKGSATKDEDFIDHLYVANMHSTMLFFTESGRCYWLKVYNIPEGSRSSKGRAIQNVLEIPNDKIKAYLNVQTLSDDEYIDNHYIVLITKNGILKKTALRAYSNVRAGGVNAITLREGDDLVDALLTDGKDEILIAARNGRCVRFHEEDARAMGRTASGVKGMTLDEGDYVIGAIAYDPDAEDASAHTVLVVSDNGYGKCTPVDEYRLVGRGGKGVKTLNITDKTGKVIAIKNVTDENDLMIIEHSGLTIRMPVSGIKTAGRNTQGVRLININEGDSIASVSVVEKEEEDTGTADNQTAEGQDEAGNQEEETKE
jgi:DNA gyrase subunit A